MDKITNDIEDINFIISEIIRFASMEFQELITHIDKNKQDGLCAIKHPFKNSELICGQEAFRRFYQITKRHFLNTLKDSASDFDEEDFIQELIKEFSNKFLKNQNEVNKSTVQSFLSATLKKSKAKHKPLTHYIPCVVVGESKPDRFNLGIVEFIRMEIFSDENQKKFSEVKKRDFESITKYYENEIKREDSNVEIPSSEEIERRADIFVKELTDYFSAYKWVAKVTIPPCDAKVSKNRAEIVVDAALDILKLIFKELHGKDLRMGHSYAVPEKIANLTVNSDGYFNISFGWRGTRNNYVGNDWFKEITKPEVHPYLQMASSVLDARISPEYKTHLKERFLDALSWYGQAVSDSLPSTKIVKYVAAWERLVITKKEKDLTSTVCRRISMLAYDGCRESYEQTLKKAKDVYEWRSNLMHGTISPFAPNINEIVPVAEKITQSTLFLAVDLFIYLSQKNEKMEAKSLEKEYEQMEQQYIQNNNSKPEKEDQV
jgi:hypothetical protein